MVDHSHDLDHYIGTDTPITAGLLILECENGHKDWYLSPHEECFRCGGKIIKGNPSINKYRAESEG